MNTFESGWRVRLLMGSAIVSLLIVGVVSYGSVLASSESERWVRHTDEVPGAMQDLSSAFERVESSARGLAFTGSETYRDSYRVCVLKIHEDEKTIRHLTADNAGQQRRIRDFEKIAAEEIRYTDMLVSHRQADGSTADG